MSTIDDMNRNPRDYSRKEIAEQLLKDSTGKNGQVDFDKLTTTINEFSRNAARHDPHYADAIKDGRANTIVSRWSNELNMAARETLNLTDKGSIGSLLEKIGFAKSETKFACTVPEGVNFNDINNGLRANGVQCRTTEPSR